MKPLRIINARAPTRINDLGGWTDTWFAGRGKVLNTAVYPGVDVQVRVYQAAGSEAASIVVQLENEGDVFKIDPESITLSRHPLVEGAFVLVKIPRRLRLHVGIYSGMPAGAATGTSAALAVSLLGALCHLAEKRLSPHEIAYLAHSLETEVLKLQCGIQDQLAAAFGGINFIDMHQYPHAHVSKLNVGEAALLEYENRLLLIYLGQGHRSSELHQKVIAGLEEIGPDNPILGKLRRLVDRGREALLAGDWLSLGGVMSENTEIQSELHPELVSAQAREIIGVARRHGALGWKVNGAGGNGGTLVILCGPDVTAKRKMAAEIAEAAAEAREIEIQLASRGLLVWETA